jgi:hypothetical protein
MRSAFFKTFVVVALFSITAQAQTVPAKWKNSTVSVESILRRYNQQQVHDLLQKQLADLGKTISQHETFERRDALEGIKDTVHGAGILLSDGAKLYIIVPKHLVKATEPLGVTHREVITDFLTAHLDNPAKKTNDINLLNFVSIVPAGSPVVFSDDQTDVAIISLQQKSKKLIADYIKQNGGVGISVQTIAKANIPGINTSAVAPLLKKLQVNEKNPAFNY